MERELRFVPLVVFLTSFSLLCYEILLTRIFSLIQWQSLASLVISLSLLGFGASGTALTMLQARTERRFPLYFQGCLLLFPIALGLGFAICCRIPFNPFELGIDPRQWLYLLSYFASAGLPFFFGAAVIGMALSHFPISSTYFLNLTGCGVGALAVILLSFVFHPFHILAMVAAIAFAAAALFSLNLGKGVRALIFSLSAILTVGFHLSLAWFHLGQPSPYKPLSRALLLPQARIVAEGYSPLGVVQAIEAEGFHYSGDLSLLCPYPVPVQKAIFCDGDSMSTVIPFNGNLKEVGYLDYLPSSLPYHLLLPQARQRALIVGVGGGEGVLKALLHGMDWVEGVEINGEAIELMRNELADFSGRIYTHPRVKILKREMRGFLSSTVEKHDLIELSLMDSYAASASGARALNETYLYTVESIQELIGHLSDQGLLAITRWNETPPRGNLKMLNLCLTALERLGVSEPRGHLFHIRSLRASTLVISRSPLSDHQIQRGKAFAQSRLFDLVHCPGIRPEEANRYVRTEFPIHYEAARSLLSRDRGAFVQNYPFDLSAPTDSRPYFYNFFKWKALPLLLGAGPQRIPITEWGSFLLVICLGGALVISFLLILLPLFFSPRRAGAERWPILFYFSLIALGFFFIELPFIQRFILFLHHSTYSLSVILSSLLVFSGVGSYFSDRLFPPRRRVFLSTLVLLAILMGYSLFLNPVMRQMSAQADWLKVSFTILLLAPLGFFMGIPFPQGLSAVKAKAASLLPWAWGINGFFSVISVILAHILAIQWGFSAVLLLAGLWYLAAGALSFQIGDRT